MATVVLVVPIWIGGWFEFKYHVIDAEEAMYFSAYHPAWVQVVVQGASLAGLLYGRSWLQRRRASVRWLWLGALACVVVNLQSTTRFAVWHFDVGTIVAGVPVADLDGIDFDDGAACFRSFSRSTWSVEVNGTTAWTPFLPLPVVWDQIDQHGKRLCPANLKRPSSDRAKEPPRPISDGQPESPFDL